MTKKLTRWTGYADDQMDPVILKNKLDYLRKELRNASISYGELAELYELKDYIDSSDVELLEAAGVLEFPEDDKLQHDADGLEDANITI